MAGIVNKVYWIIERSRVHVTNQLSGYEVKLQ